MVPCIALGMGRNSGCTPEEVLVPVFIISDYEEHSCTQIAQKSLEVSASNLVMRFDIKGLSNKDVPYLIYNGKHYDLLISAMEYEADTFASMQQKLEFLTRLFIFIEPRLNVIELAPKGTGKSYVFGNLSKYGWIISGGKVTRAKLLYDKSKEQLGILCNHDYTAFDEIQTIVFQEPAEIQAALKAYLEAGKTTIDNKEITSECGRMLMGNIPLDQNKKPINYRYFDSLPNSFRESALLDRFHCFIEGWYLPRISKNMIYKGWTINVEYFSEVMHALRTENVYGMLFDQLIEYEANADMRDFKAVKRIATAAMKLFFPHWKTVADVNLLDFDTYCLQPAIRRRGIIKTQCHHIDPEFKSQMPRINVKGL